ncbi:MAG TPA: hypothetical protein PLW31_03595 [Bacteroidales bacterium]|nr:hypothetical protein [Bacteroidales bacterium]HPI85103.1 hypothetical protein [Bacteroidales bacterium]HPM91718.1 hypothetical protein [Bacteroidales bacterium]
MEKPEPRSIILRHDVDQRPGYSLRFARMQHESGVKGSYYFRMVPQSFNETIIKEILGLGHEIGYHYETMDTCKGDTEKALREFVRNLELLKKLAPIKTICMHGSPLSKYDNRDLWGKEKSSVVSRQSSVISRQSSVVSGTREPGNPEPGTRNMPHYKDYDIIGEPYFDIDFTQVLYLTDTGRRWDGAKVSVRDKVGSHQSAVSGRRSAVEQWNSGTMAQSTRNPELKFHSTRDIIAAANAGLLPDRIMFTFHPQRWTDRPLPWLKELVMQNAKNIAKRIILSSKS